jgi:hypothetical protein
MGIFVSVLIGLLVLAVTFFLVKARLATFDLGCAEIRAQAESDQREQTEKELAAERLESARMRDVISKQASKLVKVRRSLDEDDGDE